MKRLPFTRRRVAFRVGLFPCAGCVEWQAGLVVGHFCQMERAYFDGKPSWVRWYSVRVLSGPSSMLGRVVAVAASAVVRWPFVRET